MILTIDIGNTTISFYIHKPKPVTFKIATVKRKTADEYFGAIQPMLKEHKILNQDIKQVAISSVVDEIKEEILLMIKKYFTSNILEIKPKIKTKMDIAIDNTNELGNDLLASAIGANMISQSKSFCVIDLGTATTLSIVSDNTFLGVVIMPGFEKQLESLAISTSKLPKVTINKPKTLIGKNTVDSILAGVVIGHAFAINEFIKKYQEKYHNLEIYITGGHSKWLLSYFNFNFNYLVKDYLVHEGLKQLILINFPN